MTICPFFMTSVLWRSHQLLRPRCDVFLLWSISHPRTKTLPLVEEIHHTVTAGEFPSVLCLKIKVCIYIISIKRNCFQRINFVYLVYNSLYTKYVVLSLLSKVLWNLMEEEVTTLRFTYLCN